jgi:hypothetical protein
VTEADKGSIEGRGREELLPERGNPFEEETSTAPDNDLESSSDVLPQGLERIQERDSVPHAKDQFMEDDKPMPRIEPREDGGMQAVGPPLPEDLIEDSVPPPVVEPELPPPPDNDLASLMRDVKPQEASMSEANETISSQSERGSESKADSLLVSELRWKRLHAKADLLRKKVVKEIDNPHLKQLLLDQVAIACDQELNTREQFEESERILNEVDGRVNLEEQVQKWSASLKTWVLAYELTFLCLSVIVLLLIPSAIRDYFPAWFSNLSLTIQSNLTTMLRAMIWGGLGGSVSALVGIWAHQEFEQELDRQWAIWFFANPFMGVVLGALIFLLFRVLLVGLLPSVASGFQALWILYALSMLAGFKQNVFYTFFDRLFRLSEPRRRKK